MHHLVIGPTSLKLGFDNMIAQITVDHRAAEISPLPCGLPREASNIVVKVSSLFGSMILQLM